ncbi:MAG TPA: hypothetical protein VK324_08215 [Tepidisphaeraceae bacterium]|nr:hypothetical protein [Tepidisphaeraceae bacterium]
MPTVLRRLLLWTVVCSVSAAPAFVFASGQFDRQAMVLGVGLFVVAYTAATSLPGFERFHARPFVRRTLYIGYGARLVASIAFPIGMWIDIVVGMMSIGAAERLGLTGHGFRTTLLVTCAHGAILNAGIGVLMLVAYALQRAMCKPPVALPAFEVVLPPVAQLDRRVTGARAGG